MQPTGNNPFHSDSDTREHSGTSPVGAGRETPASVQARLSRQPFGWQLDLCPMRAFDALRVWSKLSPVHDPASLLFDVVIDPGTALAVSSERTEDPANRCSLGALADRHSIPPVARLDDDQLVMDPMRMRELVGMIEPAHLRAVCVEGPIETRDAAAMRRAIAAGLSPLQVEIRATAAIEVTTDRLVTFHSREKESALRLLAERFRLFAAGVLRRTSGRGLDEVAAPDPDQVERLIDLSGTLSMRPIETDVFSTFLDIGVSTDTEPFSSPANISLIFDRPSNSWHDEP